MNDWLKEHSGHNITITFEQKEGYKRYWCYCHNCRGNEMFFDFI